MKDLLIELDSRMKMPLYEQICRFIKEEIRTGKIAPGEKLPSSRALAAQLSVSRSTVDLAYGQLTSEGYLDSVPWKVYFAGNVRELYQLGDLKRIQTQERQEQRPAFLWDFALNGIDEESFPVNIWRKISREVLLEENSGLFQLGEPQGEQSLREVIADYLHHARGVQCRPEQIVMGAGNDYLLMLLTRVMGIGTRIAMETYTYRQAYRTFCALGVPVAAIPMDEGGMCVEALDKSGANLAYVMPSHQFPVGTVMPVKRRLALLDWANGQEGRYIIEDDYDSEFRYGGRPVPALQGYDRRGRVIYMGTLSKSVAPAIRISYLVLPEPLLEVYRQKASFLASTVSRIDQMVLDEFFRDGYYERHLSRMRAAYKRKRDVLISCLRASFGEGCRISGEEAGIHLLAAFSLGQEEGELRRRAQAGGIRLYALSEYRIAPPEETQGKTPEAARGKTPEEAQGGTPEETQGGTPEAVLLLGYAHMEEAEIGEAVRELGRLLLG